MSALFLHRIRLVRLAALLGCAASLTLGQAPTAAQEPATAVVAPSASTAGVETGRVAWYGKRFAGRRTASGERFDPNAMTMAHRSLPFGTRVKVTHVESGRSVEVRVNDRGPTQPDRIGDLSLAAARSLGMVRSGVVEVRLEVLAP
jgi:rare lipoprotein A